MSASPSLNGSIAAFPAETPRIPQRDEDVDALVAQYERIAVALSALGTALAAEPEAEKKAVQLREYAKLVRAAVGYVLGVDGAALHLTDTQRERLFETDDELDDLIDTLEWATEKKAALQDLIANADRAR